MNTQTIKINVLGLAGYTQSSGTGELRVVHDAYSWKLWFLIYDFFSSAFINLENSIQNFKRKLKLTGNKKKKMTPKQKNGSLVLFSHVFIHVSRIKKGNRCEVTMKNNVKHRGEVRDTNQLDFQY